MIFIGARRAVLPNLHGERPNVDDAFARNPVSRPTQIRMAEVAVIVPIAIPSVARAPCPRQVASSCAHARTASPLMDPLSEKGGANAPGCVARSECSRAPQTPVRRQVINR